ncbi:cytochrome P450 1A2-like [Clytia hemisphaerica]|uniref:unspecific monooxygenase n=1 Tax=Clytia hemisphaerica TaxID=252671 RepID=A0A7M5VG13_9CNID
MISVAIMFLLLGLVLKYVAVGDQKKPRKLPSPTALPIIGHLHLIGSKSLHVVLESMSNIFGKVYSLKLGAHHITVLCSQKAMKEAFVKNAKKFSGRPDLPTFSYTRYGRTGISLCDHSPLYVQNRKRAVQSLHKFLMNEKNMIGIFQKEASKMVALFNQYVSEGKTFNPSHDFERIIPSMFLSIMYGIDLPYLSTDLKEVSRVYRDWFEVAEADNPADFFPVLQKFPNKRLSVISNCGKEFERFNMDMLRKELQKPSDENNNGVNAAPTTILENLLKNETAESLESEDTCKELAKLVSDMIGAGFDTIPSTLSWAFIYLSNNPNIVKKCREELDGLSTDTNNFNYTNKSKTPYFMATIYEILRMSCVAPTGVLHKSNEEALIQGYVIPKNTIVIANLYQMNFDESTWLKPNELRPERFLNDSNELDSKLCNEIATFSVGTRRCPGDKLAVAMMYAILGTFIAKYDINMVQSPIDMQPLRGMTSKPKDFLLQLTHVN